MKEKVIQGSRMREIRTYGLRRGLGAPKHSKHSALPCAMSRLLLTAMMYAGVLSAEAITYYVNAANFDPESADLGNKAGCDGSSPEKGFGTLAKAVTHGSDVSGTVFKVVAGTYDQCCPFNSRFRCYMQANTTIESIDGPEKTILVGARSTASDADELGNGTGAIAGLKLNNGCVFRGFTITGCATRNSTDSDLGYGGAVLAKGMTNCYVVDCIISNNVANRCGGAYKGTYVNCRFYDNTAIDRFAVADESGFVNCVFANNTGLYDVGRATLLVNCTFGSHNPKPGSTVVLGCIDVNCPAVNCIFISRADLTTSSGVAKYATNCVCVQSFPHTITEVGCTNVGNVAALGLDADLKPTRGSVAVGYGSTDDFPSAYLDYATIDKTPRILNDNKIDAGAYEYDWRTDYAAAIGGGVTVTNATSAVRMGEGGKVEIPNGAAIAGTMAAPVERTRVSYTASSTGAGALTGGFANGLTGVLLDSCTVSDAEEARSFVNRKDVPLSFSFGFAGAGYGSIWDVVRVSEHKGLVMSLK